MPYLLKAKVLLKHLYFKEVYLTEQNNGSHDVIKKMKLYIYENVTSNSLEGSQTLIREISRASVFE